MSTMQEVVSMLVFKSKTRRDISLDCLLPSPYQPREGIYENSEDLQQLAYLIEVAGLDPVPLVRPHPEKAGCYEIIQGHRRIKAIQKYLPIWKSVPCDVVEGLSEDGVVFRVAQDNSGRRAWYPYEKGKYFRFWRKKVGTDIIAKRFKRSTDAILAWIKLADDVDFLVRDLDPETRDQFILNMTNEIIAEVKRIKERDDRIEAVKKVAAGATFNEIREFVVGSLSSARSFGSNAGGSPHDKEAEKTEHPVKQVIKTLKEAEKSQSYDEIREKLEKLKERILPTLDQYMKYEETIEQINNPKNAAVIRVIKPGTMHVIHQVDEKGNGLCIHQTKTGKRPIIAKFKIQI